MTKSPLALENDLESDLENVEATAQQLVEALVARHERVKPTEAAPTRAEFHAGVSTRSRRKFVIAALCGLTFAGLGTQQTVQWASDRKETHEPLTEVAQGSVGEPRFVITAAGLEPRSFMRFAESPPDGATAELTLDGLTFSIFGARNATMPVKPADSSEEKSSVVQVGPFAGYQTVRSKTDEVAVQWQSGPDYFFAWFAHMPSAAVRERLSKLRLGPNGELDVSGLKGNVVVDLGPTSGYEISYNDGFILAMANGYQFRDSGARTTVVQNGRAYTVVAPKKESVPVPAGSTSVETAFWEQDGVPLFLRHFTANPDTQKLLDVADSVRPATKGQWFQLMEIAGSQQESNTDVMLQGKIDDDPWKFVTEKSSTTGACRIVTLFWVDQDRTDCVESDAGLISFARVEVVNGVPLAYGTTDGKSQDSYVVRVTDAEGDVVGEEVTQDQQTFPGRAFAFPIDEESIGPLTFELFNFEREWYINNYRNDPETPYVNPEAEPLTSVEVPLPR